LAQPSIKSTFSAGTKAKLSIYLSSTFNCFDIELTYDNLKTLSTMSEAQRDFIMKKQGGG
tara:strand:- start:506 stop:685 length:180 start_codon:yes stop_codon:yes gene_type:complete